MFVIIVFRLGSDKLVFWLFYCLSQGIMSRYVTRRLRDGGLFFIFDYSSPFCFLLIQFHYALSISYIVLTCYVYYYYRRYCSWLGFDKLFSCFFEGFLLFSPKGSVTWYDQRIVTGIPFEALKILTYLEPSVCWNIFC